MAIVPARLLDRDFPDVVHDWAERDTILYALGCGLGADPLDAGQLRFVYERAEGGLQALPTLANVLGYPGFWADQPDTGIAWRRLVHAEQALTLHRPLPTSGRAIGRNRIVSLVDKGEAKGALMVQRRTVADAAGILLATVTQTALLRGDGGFALRDGVPAAMGEPLPAPHAMPTRPADAVHDSATSLRAALLYRLSGDRNPLHADPAVARAAGFSRPILHGMCTMGIALHAAIAALLGGDAAPVAGMRVRFTAPVLPGETLRTALWRDGDVVSLRTTALERDVVVLDAGRIDLHS